MTKLNLDYYQGEDGYSDGTVETDLLRLFREGKTADEILREKQTWPYLYHLSQIRENILSWFPFKKDCTILEIGSGCGALTALLSSRAKEVTSIELTKPRAEVNYARNKDLDNVEIIVGNFNSIPINKKYDYIILNGVLEYAGSFTDSKTPYKTFLDSVCEYLKEDGALIIAIENRIGIKYINGAPEDHTGELFSGINKYAGVNHVKTFSKNELINLLKSVGLKTIDFFYPYPDYKLPETIVTDETIDLLNIEASEKNYNSNRLRFFDEEKFAQTLSNEKILDHFLNSFLVVCSRQEQDFKKVLFAKISKNRGRKFAVMTTIEEENNERIVKKKPLYPEGREHLEKMYEFYTKHKDDPVFSPVEAKLDEEGISFKFLTDSNLEQKLLEYVETNNREALKKELKKIKDYLIQDSEYIEDGYTPEFKEVFGEAEIPGKLHFKKGSNFDMLLPNIIDDDKYHTIDYEWTFDFPVPQELVYYRLLYYFYLFQNIESYLTIADLMFMADEEGEEPFLRISDIPIYHKWDENFGLSYVKQGVYEPKPMKTRDSSKALKWEMLRADEESSLYVSFDEGFSEENRIRANLNLDKHRFSVTFDFKALEEFGKKEITGLRWDPLEDFVVVSDLKFYTDKGELHSLTSPPYTADCIYNNGEFIFVTNDPSLHLFGDLKGISRLTVEGKLDRLNVPEAFEELSELIKKKKALDEAYEKLNRELGKTRLELIYRENELHNRFE